MTTPRTEAGQALLLWLGNVYPTTRGMAATEARILAIEAEATAAERARIREAVEGLPTDGAPTVIADGIRVSGPSVYLRDVLALLSEDPS